MLGKNKLIIAGLLSLIGILGLYPFYLPEQEKARAYGFFNLAEKQIQEMSIIQYSTLLPFSYISNRKPTVVMKKINVVATAYSPSIEETDDTPFVTASGANVREGIIASNLLPFGTKVRFPKLFANKIFIVEDRMHWRVSNNNVDIFFFSKQDALNFGARYTEMEVLN